MMLLPAAPAEDLAAWKAWNRQWKQSHPNGPEFAPPEYIAYAGLKLAPATSTPYRFEVQYNYDTASGALTSVTNAQTGFVYWQAATGGAAPVDAFGHLLAWTDGNNVSTVMAYDAATGAPLGISSGIGQSSAVQSLTYTWDGYGNLSERQDTNQTLTETFGYDALNRLAQSTVTNPAANGPTLGFVYDAAGNITSKTVAGVTSTYTYDPSHPYAVDSVTNVNGGTYTASYDADDPWKSPTGDGNMITRDGLALTWTPANLPSSMTGALGSSTFNYDPEHNRYYQTASLNGVSTDTTYVAGGLFEVVATSSGTTEYRHDILADGQVVAVHTITQGGNASTAYLHYDHLGSVDTITNDSGSVIQSMSFDAFGQRRIATSWDYGVSQTTLTTLKDYTDRGYTDEEELDNLSLVDLNGRVYDPTVGRFISADPTGGSGTGRYTYVGDNPLEFTDPTGYCGGWLDFICDPLQKVVTGTVNTVTEGVGHLANEAWNYAPEIAAVVAAYYTGGASSALFGTGFWGTVGTGAAAGGAFAATDTTLHGGNGTQIFDNGLRGAAIGGVGGGLLYGANEVTSYSGGNFGVGLVSHGVAGGLTSETAGGNFNQGFELGGLAYTAYWGYQQMVNDEAPTASPGQGTQLKPLGFCGCNEGITYNNVLGANTTPLSLADPGLLNEGGVISDALNDIPGINAVATLHDIWADNLVNDLLGSNSAYYATFAIPSVVPALTITYSALINTPIGYGVVFSHEATSGGP